MLVITRTFSSWNQGQTNYHSTYYVHGNHLHVAVCEGMGCGSVWGGDVCVNIFMGMGLGVCIYSGVHVANVYAGRGMHVGCVYMLEVCGFCMCKLRTF